MIIYCFLNVIVAILSILYLLLFAAASSPLRRTFASLLFVFFVIVIAFRPLDSPDTLSYKNIYYSSDSILKEISEVNLFLKYGNVDGSVEYGFLFLCSLMLKVFPSYRFFFGIIAAFNAIIISFCLYKLFFKKKEKDAFFLILALYMCSFGILYSGIAIRAGMGIAIGLISAVFAKNKRVFLCSAFLLLGFCIHRASIIFAFADIILFLSEIKQKNSLNKNAINKLIVIEAFLLFVAYILFAFAISQRIEGVLTLVGLQSYLSYFSGNVKLGVTKTIVCFIVFAVLAYSVNKKCQLSSGVTVLLMIVPVLAVAFVSFMAASRLYDQLFVLVLGALGYTYVYLLRKRKKQINYAIIFFSVLLSFVFLNTVFTFTG